MSNLKTELVNFSNKVKKNRPFILKVLTASLVIWYLWLKFIAKDPEPFMTLLNHLVATAYYIVMIPVFIIMWIVMMLNGGSFR